MSVCIIYLQLHVCMAHIYSYGEQKKLSIWCPVLLLFTLFYFLFNYIFAYLFGVCMCVYIYSCICVTLHL